MVKGLEFKLKIYIPLKKIVVGNTNWYIAPKHVKQ